MLSFNNFTEQETELISYYLKHNISLFELSIKFNISEHKTKNILKTFNHINHTSNYKIKIFRKYNIDNRHYRHHDHLIKNALKLIYKFVENANDKYRGKYQFHISDKDSYYSELFNFVLLSDDYHKIYNNYHKYKIRVLKPSIDHIVPISKGGDYFDINNLRIVTLMENLAKNDCCPIEWDTKQIEEYFI